MHQLERLASSVGSVVDRRQFLRRIAIGAAGTVGGVGGVVAASLPSTALAASNSGGAPTLAKRLQESPVKPLACNVFCSPQDCTPCVCGCPGELFKCTNFCDGSYFYGCSDPCTGFCYSFSC